MTVIAVETGEIEGLLEGHDSYVNDVIVSANGKFAISACDDSTMRVWYDSISLFSSNQHTLSIQRFKTIRMLSSSISSHQK